MDKSTKNLVVSASNVLPLVGPLTVGAAQRKKENKRLLGSFKAP